MKILLDYHWPGNVRELHNVIEYAFAVGRGNTLRVGELPPEFLEPQNPEQPLNPPIIPRDQQADAIRQALAQYQGKVNPAAQSLGMSRATFWRKRKVYGI
jgi:transcriptional regulator of acetoin/glycerol metabolism